MTEYKVVGLWSNQNTKLYNSFSMLWAAKAYAQELLKQPLGLQDVFVYAVDADNAHMLVTTINWINKTIKDVELTC